MHFCPLWYIRLKRQLNHQLNIPRNIGHPDGLSGKDPPVSGPQVRTCTARYSLRYNPQNQQGVQPGITAHVSRRYHNLHLNYNLLGHALPTERQAHSGSFHRPNAGHPPW